jgi:hypothetical protein
MTDDLHTAAVAEGQDPKMFTNIGQKNPSEEDNKNSAPDIFVDKIILAPQADSRCQTRTLVQKPDADILTSEDETTTDKVMSVIFSAHFYNIIIVKSFLDNNFRPQLVENVRF